MYGWVKWGESNAISSASFVGSFQHIGDDGRSVSDRFHGCQFLLGRLKVTATLESPNPPTPPHSLSLSVPSPLLKCPQRGGEFRPAH